MYNIYIGTCLYIVYCKMYISRGQHKGFEYISRYQNMLPSLTLLINASSTSLIYNVCYDIHKAQAYIRCTMYIVYCTL